jgi:hypothetical protein
MNEGSNLFFVGAIGPSLIFKLKNSHIFKLLKILKRKFNWSIMGPSPDGGIIVIV